MDTAPSTQKNLISALRRAAIFVIITVAGCLVLGFSVLYLPENYFLREEEVSRVKDWLPEKYEFPQNMILVSESATTNREAAQTYPDPEAIYKKFESWGREEGYSRRYMSRNRCTTTGPRSIRVGIVRYGSPDGVQEFLDWSEARELAQGGKASATGYGDDGYLLQVMQPGKCSLAHPERRVEIIFQRGDYLGVVELYAAADQNSENDLLKIAGRLAELIDRRIQAEITQP